MKPIAHLLTVAMLTLALVACADASTGDELTTTVAPLTDAEAAALDTCLAEIAECRLDAADSGELSAECRAIMECLPDRPDDELRAGLDWRAFCNGLEDRCVGDDMDAELCSELAERCKAAALEGSGETMGSEPPATKAECLEDCLGAGIDDDACSDRCADLEDPL